MENRGSVLEWLVCLAAPGGKDPMHFLPRVPLHCRAPLCAGVSVFQDGFLAEYARWLLGASLCVSCEPQRLSRVHSTVPAWCLTCPPLQVREPSAVSRQGASSGGFPEATLSLLGADCPRFDRSNSSHCPLCQEGSACTLGGSSVSADSKPTAVG